jgi:hypothetical protein
MTPEIITPETEPTRFQCRHIFTDGRRCGSPTIRGAEGRSDADSFCYYHHNSRRPVQHAPTRKRRQSRFALPNPEDRSAIQQALGQVLQRIASNEIDPRRAALLLYGLQIASLNLKKDHKNEDLALVSEVTHDPEHGLLAPPAELHANRPKSSIEILLDELPAELPAEDPINLQASASDDELAQPTEHANHLHHNFHQRRSGRRHRTIPSAHERMSSMSNFIPKQTNPKLSGLGPKAQKLAALREKAEQANTNAAAATSESTSAAKPKNSFAGKKTAFQRKAT